MGTFFRRYEKVILWLCSKSVSDLAKSMIYAHPDGKT